MRMAALLLIAVLASACAGDTGTNPTSAPAPVEPGASPPAPEPSSSSGAGTAEGADQFTGHEGLVRSVTVLADGRVATGGDDDGTVQIWDPVDLDAAPIVYRGHSGKSIWSIVELPDGRVVSTSFDGAHVWDPSEPATTVAVFDDHEDIVGNKVVPAAALLADGRMVTVGTDDLARVWDPDGSSEPVLYERHADDLWGVVVLDDGRIVVGGDDGLHVWSLDDPAATLGATPVGSTQFGQGQPLVLLRDGRVLLGSREVVQVFDPDMADAGPTDVITHEVAAVSALLELADGRIVSADQASARVRIWSFDAPDVIEGEWFGDARMKDMAQLPDGRIVSVGAFVTLWDPDDAVAPS